MNKSKHPLPAKVRKKMVKEIRSAFPTREPKITSDDITATQVLSRYPQKIRRRGANLLNSFEKEIIVKTKKRVAKHSKRTTPGFVDKKSPPHHAHVENERWIRSLESQTLNKNKIFTRKMAKKK
jgi:hypothetical protein